MKRKLFLSSAVIPALLASGAMGQVVNFHDAANGQLAFPGVGYEELFVGQGAYSDPGNDIWNGFGFYAGYKSTYFYSDGPGGSGPWPQEYGNPGNPYAAYNSGSGWVSSTGPSLFNFTTGSLTNTGNATSGGQWTPITLSVSGYGGDNGIGGVGSFVVPTGSPAFLLGEAAYKNGTTPSEVFTLENVPAGTYGLFLYGANYDNNRGTLFSVNSGNAHNGIAATLNGMNGSPAPGYVEGQNFVIFENVTPNASGNIIITASPNPQDGVGNTNLTGETDVNGFQLIFNPPPTAIASTAAQNVRAGGTASFSFTPVFASSPSFRWQFISAGVTNVLSDVGNINGSATTNLTISSVASTNVGLYQCVITTASATNATSAAPLTLLTSTGTNVLQPADVVTDFNNNTNSPYNSLPPPFMLTSPENVNDDTLTEYINFGGNDSVAPFSGPVGFVVTPRAGVSVVTGLRLFTASSHPEDDPADYLLEGSTDGVNFTAIAGGLLALPAQRNAAAGVINVTNQVLQEIDFPNTTAYGTYRLTFTNVNNDTIASNGVQIAEVQLLGSLADVPPGILQQPASGEVLLAGVTLNASVVANGIGPDTYQWYYNSTNKISAATNAALTIPNVQTNATGNYTCTISNFYGSTNSAALSLTVETPSAYQKQLLTFAPLAYWPLEEISGSVAYDYVGGYNGTYIGGPGLLQPGVPTPGFGSPSYSVEFTGDNYVDVPLGPFNITTPVTIMAWVQQSAFETAFADILGHGDSSYRLSVNTSGDPGFNDGNNSSGDATSSGSIVDGNWHFIVGVYEGGSGAAANGFLYVDSALVASNMIRSVVGNSLDLYLAGAPDYTTRYLSGNLCHVAVIPQALSQSQIQALFGAAGTAPLVTVPATVAVDQDGNGSIHATALGDIPFSFQWSYLNQSSQTVTIPSATNSTLQLTNVQTSWGSFEYFVVVSNAYGVVTSSYVTLNVQSGAPVVAVDLSPLLVEVPVGIPVTFSVTATGTEPFSYQWYQGSGAIGGATSSSYSFTALAGSNSYSVAITNTDSAGTPTTSSMAVVLGLTNPPPVITFGGDGTGWTLNRGSGWPGATNHPSIVNDLLTLTDGTNGEISSAFFNTPQYIGGFVATFTYTSATGTSSPEADGSTFCLQNAPAGTNALGGGGGSLAYYGITPSAAFEMNLYPYASGGSGVQFGTDGSTPDSVNPTVPYSSVAPVSLSSGDPINVQLYFNENVATVWLVDSKTGNSFTTTYTVPDMPAIVGGSSALVGFTGATGGDNSIQRVSDFMFSYTTPPILSVARSTGQSAVISWPVSVATLFVLQGSAHVNGPWANVTATPVIVNSMNQVTLTPGTSTAFYRLSLQ